MPAMAAGAVTVRPARTITGRIAVPGDKSISHRYALLAALADGVSTISCYSPGEDCASTLRCLQGLGVRIRHEAGAPLAIAGRGIIGLQAPDHTLDAGNSGTTMRLVAGIAAAHPFRSVIDGDASLARRPMRRVIEPLARMGAAIEARDGRPPLTIHGARLRGIAHTPEIPSAQVKSALLLAGLQAEGRTMIDEPVQTRDHTERALVAFGAAVDRGERSISLEGGQRLRPAVLTVPGDISSATYWMVLAAATPGSDLEISGVGLNPTRTAVIDVLRRAGATIEATVDAVQHGEPVGRIRVAGGNPHGFEIAAHEVPGVIDEVPALAALGALLPENEVLHVEGAAELRVKESDRIAGLARGFRAMGALVEEYPDGFQLTARPLCSTTVDAFEDHRLAMAFAVAATGASGPVTITGAACVSVSYPRFFEDLARLARPR